MPSALRSNAAARARKLGGAGEGGDGAPPPRALKALSVPAALIPRPGSPGARSVQSVETEVPATWWQEGDPVFDVPNQAAHEDGNYYIGPANWVPEDPRAPDDWVPLVGGRRRKRAHEPAVWDAKWQTRVLCPPHMQAFMFNVELPTNSSAAALTLQARLDVDYVRSCKCQAQRRG